jgi:hypothetical protein
MLDDAVSDAFSALVRPPAFRVYGRGKREHSWHIVNVLVTQRRNRNSRWPLWRGRCITWTSSIISVGADFGQRFLDEQACDPATCLRPAMVSGGRMRDANRRMMAGAREWCTATEVLAHECGHTWQARRLGDVYWLLVGSVTMFGEGPHSWNFFENQASEEGQLGGLVDHSINMDLTATADT